MAAPCSGLDPVPDPLAGALPLRRVVVTVGTDVHPFDRLVRWADLWALDHPDAEVLVQYGTSRPPRWATGRVSLPRQDLLDAFAAADVVVASCGPGAVMDARSVGRRPVVVARRQELGEIVDGHQHRFAAHLDRTGLALAVDDQDALRAVLDGADRTRFHLPHHEVGRPADGSGRDRVGALVDRLVWTT